MRHKDDGGEIGNQALACRLPPARRESSGGFLRGWLQQDCHVRTPELNQSAAQRCPHPGLLSYWRLGSDRILSLSPCGACDAANRSDRARPEFFLAAMALLCPRCNRRRAEI